MRIQPIVCFPEIDNAAIVFFECSDRFLFPKTYFEGLGYTPHTLVTIANVRRQEIIGAIFGVHEFDDVTIYVPSWLFSKMDIHENVEIGSITKKKCHVIQIKPHNSAFVRNPDFLKLVQLGLTQYFSLTQNTRIPLKVNDSIEYITIALMLPEQNKTCFIYNSGNVSLQILDPLETEEAPLEYLYNTSSSRALVPFPGAGHALGSPCPKTSAESKMNAMAAAGAAARIRYRMAKIQEYSLRKRRGATALEKTDIKS